MSASRVAIAVGLTMLLAVACGEADRAPETGPNADDGLRIASFDFAESELLAELYAQVVETTGTPVVRLPAVGPREVVMPALESGLVDVVPEYLGTALRWQGVDAPAEASEAVGMLDDRLRSSGLTLLDAARAEDVNVIVVASRTAEREGLTTISDLRRHAASMRFGGPPECPDRPLCLIGLEEEYGLRFGEFVAQRSQRFTAEALRRREIDVGLMFSTEPAVTARDLTVLVDDRRLQPAENVVPVVRLDALERWGTDVGSELDRLSAALTTGTLRLLNRRVAAGADVAQVAHDWLRAAGLIAAD